MHWPQITLLALWTLGLGVHLARHGERVQQSHYNFPARLIGVSVWVCLLWAGGFFDG